MSEPHFDPDNLKPRRQFLHGRHLGPAVKPLIGCVIVAGLIYAFETAMPAFHDVVKIGYFIVAVIFVILAGRAFRTRERGRRVAERRHHDRRGSPGEG